MRVLLLEGNPDDATLAREAMLEIEESRRWRRWVRHLDVAHLERLDDALAVLAEERFDLALVASSLPDARGLDPLLAMRVQAPELPVVYLVPEGDEPLALSAVREGAEDCLLKSELDCGVLARALRHAAERHRRSAALREAALLDADTGLHNRRGFLAAAERDRLLARRLSRPLSVVVATLEHGPGLDDVALAPIELAGLLRLSFADTDLLARVDPLRFAVSSIANEGEDITTPLAALRHRLALRNRRAGEGAVLRVGIGVATCGPRDDWTVEELLSLAQTSVCENGHSGPAGIVVARPAGA